MAFMVETLVAILCALFETLPDSRSGVNIQYAFDDIAMVAFTVFFIQQPLFVDYQRKFQESHNRNIRQSLSAMTRIPCDNAQKVFYRRICRGLLEQQN